MATRPLDCVRGYERKQSKQKTWVNMIMTVKYTFFIEVASSAILRKWIRKPTRFIVPWPLDEVEGLYCHPAGIIWRYCNKNSLSDANTQKRLLSHSLMTWRRKTNDTKWVTLLSLEKDERWRYCNEKFKQKSKVNAWPTLVEPTHDLAQKVNVRARTTVWEMPLLGIWKGECLFSFVDAPLGATIVGSRVG